MPKKADSKAIASQRDSAAPRKNPPSREASKGNTKEMRQQALSRRRFILDEIRAYGSVSAGKLGRHFPGVHQESLRQDREFFNGLGIQITARKDGSLYDAAANRTVENKGFREQNVPEKHLVAAMVKSMIIGFDTIDEDVLKSAEDGSIHPDLSDQYEDSPMGIGAMADQRVTGQYIQLQAAKNRKEHDDRALHEILQDGLPHLRSCEKIISMIMSQGVQTENQVAIDKTVCSDLKNKLVDFWNEKIRMCMFDSGTTNEILSEKLASLAYPYRNANLSYFSVCTNSRAIFQILGEPTVPIRTIIIGGQQRGGTSTIAGAVAEYFLRGAALLNFGICAVGSTSIAIDEGKCFTDSPEEGVIKNIALSKSNIRIVAVDSSKLSRRPVRGGYSFVAIDRRLIDAIVTNVPLKMEYFHGKTEAERTRHQRLIEDFWKMVDDIRARQVNVILGSDDRFCIKRS